MDKPACIAIDALGNAYIADAGSQFIHKFDSRGTPLLSFQETFFENPDSIAVDDGGAIYVADSVRGVVWIFLPSGERYRPLRLPRHTGAEYPLSVTVGDDGLIDVLDTGTDKVFTYNPRLRFLHSWQPAADARDPSSHPSAIAAASDGYFYALDPPANRILRFDSDRRLVSVIDAGAGGMGRKLSGEFAVSEGLDICHGLERAHASCVDHGWQAQAGRGSHRGAWSGRPWRASTGRRPSRAASRIGRAGLTRASL